MSAHAIPRAPSAQTMQRCQAAVAAVNAAIDATCTAAISGASPAEMDRLHATWEKAIEVRNSALMRLYLDCDGLL